MELGPPSCCYDGEVWRESNFNHSTSHRHRKESTAISSVPKSNIAMLSLNVCFLQKFAVCRQYTLQRLRTSLKIVCHL